MSIYPIQYLFSLFLKIYKKIGYYYITYFLKLVNNQLFLSLLFFLFMFSLRTQVLGLFSSAVLFFYLDLLTTVISLYILNLTPFADKVYPFFDIDPQWAMMSMTGKKVAQIAGIGLGAVVLGQVDGFIQDSANSKHTDVLIEKCNSNGTPATSEQIVQTMNRPSTLQKVSTAVNSFFPLEPKN